MSVVTSQFDILKSFLKFLYHLRHNYHTSRVSLFTSTGLMRLDEKSLQSSVCLFLCNYKY